MGMSTVLPENWTTFSGGQGQRLRLARALVRQPSILILDEATSAVDTRTEALILRALRRLSARQTTVIRNNFV